MKHDLTGRVAVVTGASAGIGRACAVDMVLAGARAVINARREEPLRALARELGEDRVAVVAGDCADEGVIGRMLDAAKGLDARGADLVLVNAGRGLNGSVMSSDTAQWEEMVRTNLLGAASLIRAAGNHMLAQVTRETGADASLVGLARGSEALNRARDIVVVGSTVGRHISPFSSMYGSTKFAVGSLAEAARRELGPRGVRVTLIAPAFVRSEFQGVAGYAEEWFKGVVDRIGPVLSPEDIAETICWTCSLPARVHANDIVIRPTRQDYP